jgi:hypothetical protein
MEKMERLEGEYKKVRKALEFVMELVEDAGQEDLKGHLFKKRKEQLMAEQAGNSNLKPLRDRNNSEYPSSRQKGAVSTFQHPKRPFQYGKKLIIFKE